MKLSTEERLRRLRNSQAAYRRRAKSSPAGRVCLCGNPAHRLKFGTWVCKRCDDLELRMQTDFHENLRANQPTDSRKTLTNRKRKSSNPFEI